MAAPYIGEKKRKENQTVGLKIGEVEVKWNARGKNIAEEIVQAEERLTGIRKKQKHGRIQISAEVSSRECS